MPKKILINAVTLDDGNIVPLLSKVRWWQGAGAEVTFFGNEFLKKKIETTGLVRDVRYCRLPGGARAQSMRSKAGFMFESLGRNIRAIRVLPAMKGSYDIVYSISSVLDLVLVPCVLKKIDARIRWVTVFDNIVPFSDPGNKATRFLAWLFFQFSLLCLKRADMIFAISDELKEFLIRKGFSPGKIVVTGNGIESAAIQQASKNSQYAFDALFVGRINETKGIYDLLRVLAVVRGVYPDFQLAIMGAGDSRTTQQFKAAITRMNLEHNVQFLGHTAGIEKFSIIKSSKCFLFLSVSASESFGIALLEAVCCGIPACAYDLPPYRALYQHNEVFIFKKNDYRAVAQKVIELHKTGNFTNNAGTKLLPRYSWERIAAAEYAAWPR